MKNILFAIIVLALMPMVVLAANPPVFVDDFNMSVATGAPGESYVVSPFADKPINFVTFDNLVAFNVQQTSSSKMKIFNLATNNLVYEASVSTVAAQPQSVVYDNGYVFSWGATASNTVFAVFDVSNPAFITSDSCSNIPQPISNTQVLTNNGGGVYYFLGADGDTYKLNASGCFFEQTNSHGSFDEVVTPDRVNSVYAVGTKLVNYEDESSQFDVFTLPGGVGDFADWNRNNVNPEYITDDGFIVIVGGAGYSDVRVSSLGLGAAFPDVSGPYMFFERSNIVARNATSNTWVSIDATDLINPIVTDTLVDSRGDVVHRMEDNTLMSYDTFNDRWSIFTVDEPDFDFVPPDVDTLPTVEADFLGVDNFGDFIFLTEMNDVQGGRVYLSQSLFPASLEVGETFTVSEEINFNSLSVLDRIRDKKATTSAGIESPSIFNYTEAFENSLVLRPFIGDDIFIDFKKPVTSSQTDTVEFFATTAFYDDNEIGDQPLYRLSALSSSGDELFKFEFEGGFFGADDTEIILVQGASRTTVFNGPVYDQDGNKDIHILTATINFATQSSDITIRGANQTFYNGTVAFTNAATTLGGVGFTPLEGNAFFNNEYYFANLGYEYGSSVVQQLDYQIFDTLEPGVSVIKLTSEEGPHDFGTYALYSYATDDDFGFTTTSSNDVESFVYSETTDVLTQDEINEALVAAQSGAGLDVTGDFAALGVIEGDIITDNLLGSLEEAGFKSNASKLALGIVIVLVLMAFGFTYGAAGAIVGGVMGLILADFINLIPSWVTASVIIALALLAAFEARKAIIGR